MPVFLSTKNTILQSYDESFKQVFDTIYNENYKTKYENIGIFYQHRLIDDMIACLINGLVDFCGLAKIMMEMLYPIWWLKVLVH